ncbi:2-oxo acid dehydrogenase subunit E2 [Mycoplasmatota bacterium]|nr:2-oxo acid dehydrogenase subunit E2 [Mycoplasmatota bacterium]
MYQFKFADVGEGVHEGQILEWKVKVGDKVKDGDTLVIVETDKVNAELPSPVDGTISKIYFKEGEEITVGQVVVDIDDGTGKAPEVKAEAKPEKEETKKETKEKTQNTGSNGYQFKFADVGEGVHEGTILEWKVKVGDKVKDGDTMVIVETDKVNAELPSPVDGTISKIFFKEGEEITVGQVIVTIDDGQTHAVETAAVGEGEEEEEKAAGVIGEIEVSSEVMASSNESHAPKAEAKPAHKKALATPVARKLAKDLNVDINLVPGSGFNGRVLREDIETFANKKTAPQTTSAPQVTVSTQGDVELVPISRLRKAIVKSMTLSKQVIPHTVMMDEIVVDKLYELRQKLKPLAAEEDIKLTYMAFIFKAVVMALEKFPYFNASFDQENQQMVVKKFYNIGMAVDTPDGLIVPNIKDANLLSLFGLAKEIQSVGNATKNRNVSLDKLQNTTFSITNFGAANVSLGTPIINHPEVAILGVGKISQKAVVEDGEIKASYTLPLSLAVDHRVIDGADAGRFLTYFKKLMSDPLSLLVN